MGNREDALKHLIELEYGSIPKFSEVTGVPRSTVYNILDRGIENTRTKTMETVYALVALDKEPEDDRLSDSESEVLDMFRKMSDEQRVAVIVMMRAMLS